MKFHNIFELLTSNRFTIIWTLLLALFTGILAILLPAKVALQLQKNIYIESIDILISIIFIADIVIRIISRKNHNDKVRYFRTWFIIDFVAIFPTILLMPDSLWLLLPLVKMIHVGSDVRTIQHKLTTYSGTVQLLQFAFILCIVLHWVSLIWYVLREYNVKTDQSLMSKYIMSLYWATSTLSTVGYGDITANTDEQRFFVICVMLLGMVLYAYLIGNIAHILNRIDIAKVHHDELIENAHAFIRYKKIPTDLQRRIYDYYSYMWENRRGYDETNFLKHLPPALSHDISYFLKQDILTRTSILNSRNPVFTRDVIQHLNPQIVMPGDYIFHSGDNPDAIYFISQGSVEILNADGSVKVTLQDGDVFGEQALLSKRPRLSSCRAITTTDVYFLNTSSFTYLRNTYPDFDEHIKHIAAERLHENLTKIDNKL